MAEKSKGRKVDDAVLGRLDTQFIELREQFRRPGGRDDIEEVRRVMQWLQEGKEVTLAEALNLVIGERFTPLENNPHSITEPDKSFHLPEDFTSTPVADCISLLEEYYGDLHVYGQEKILEAERKAYKLAKKYGINRQRIILTAIPSLEVANRIAQVKNPLKAGHGLVIERAVFSLLEDRYKKVNNLPFANYRSGNMGKGYLEPLKVYGNFLKRLTDDVNIVPLLVDAFQGYSVSASRFELEHHYPQIIPAGSYIVAHLLAEMPQIMSKSGHLRFDAPGDLYDWYGRRDFSDSLYFAVGGDGLLFSRGHADSARSDYSSVVVLSG